MTTTDIREACFAHLNTFVYAPQPTILWPSLQLEPPDEGLWLEPKLFPNENTDVEWDDDARPRVRGYFQVSVYFRVRPSSGEIEASRVADALIAHFPKGTTLGSVYVRVRKPPYQSPVITADASRSFIPVTIPYLGSM